jgi:hypothetical protein
MLIDGHHVKVPATSFCKIFLLIQPQTWADDIIRTHFSTKVRRG